MPEARGGWSWTFPRSRASRGSSRWARSQQAARDDKKRVGESHMAKVQADKPKSSLAGLFGFGGSKPKAAARPAAVGSTTATNIPAAGGPTTTGRAKAASAKKPAAK